MPVKPRKAIGKHLRRAVWNKTDGRCWYCGTMTQSHVQGVRGYQTRTNIDHQHPHCKGGPDDLENLVIACGSCNYDKSTRTLDEYREVIRAGCPRYATEQLIEDIGRFSYWETGEIHEEMLVRLRGFLEYLDTRSISFHGECLNMDQSDYCI